MFAYTTYFSEFKILIGSPGDSVSSFTATQMILAPGHKHSLLVTPTFIRYSLIMMMTLPNAFCSSTDDIQDIAPEKRQCLFPSEESLELFEDYSFSNCILECYISKVSNTTRCVPWFLPRSASDQVQCDWPPIGQ